MTERCRGFMSDVTHDISGIYDSAAVRIIIRHVSREINRVNDREVAMRLLAERDIRPATVEKVLFRDKRRKESVGNRLTWCRLLAETCDGRPDTPRVHVRPYRSLVVVVVEVVTVVVVVVVVLVVVVEVVVVVVVVVVVMVVSVTGREVWRSSWYSSSSCSSWSPTGWRASGTRSANTSSPTLSSSAGWPLCFTTPPARTTHGCSTLQTTHVDSTPRPPSQLYRDLRQRCHTWRHLDSLTDVFLQCKVSK